MRKFVVACMLISLICSGCGFFKKSTKKDRGITKGLSRQIASEQMAGTAPCGYVDLGDSYCWEFWVRQEGRLGKMQVFVNKTTGVTTTSGIKYVE